MEVNENPNYNIFKDKKHIATEIKQLKKNQKRTQIKNKLNRLLEQMA